MFDYRKLQQYLHEKFNADRMQIYYYTAYPAIGTRDYPIERRHKFYTFLKKELGFIVRKKALKRIKVIRNGKEEIKEKGNMDVEMSIDVVHNKGLYDIAVLFTGDADFLALVNYVRNNGKRVYIFSSQKNISRELRSGGDGYVDVLNIEDIWRGKLRQSALKYNPSVKRRDKNNQRCSS